MISSSLLEKGTKNICIFDYHRRSTLQTAIRSTIKLGACRPQVGLNSVIGAGSFVTSVVVGVVAIVAVSSSEVQLQRSVFFRDVGFYLAAIVVSSGAETPNSVCWQSALF
jgi:hypothetical protein